MSSGPERTRRTEPRWGAVSVGCRAIRLPSGSRRDESRNLRPPAHHPRPTARGFPLVRNWRRSVPSLKNDDYHSPSEE